MEKSSKQEQHLRKRPSAILSLMPIVMLVAMLTCTIRSFGSNALDGASQITLLAVSALLLLQHHISGDERGGGSVRLQDMEKAE